MEISEKYRPYLFSVAYNILGQVEEAEDIVQEAFVYYLSLPADRVQNIKSYLCRVVANKSIDRLKDLKKQRESYPGTWLPEPYIHNNGAADNSAEKDILSIEALNALECLNPVERAVFVLREAFGLPYSELASICDTSEANCRKILSRSRQKISTSNSPQPVKNEELMPLMEAFLKAVAEEDTTTLTRLLKEDIVLYSDGGGRVAAALNPVSGSYFVSRFLAGIAKKRKDEQITWSVVLVNRQPAILLSSPLGPDSLISFAIKDSLISGLYIIRNPEKLLFK